MTASLAAVVTLFETSHNVLSEEYMSSSEILIGAGSWLVISIAVEKITKKPFMQICLKVVTDYGMALAIPLSVFGALGFLFGSPNDREAFEELSVAILGLICCYLYKILVSLRDISESQKRSVENAARTSSRSTE